MTTNRRLRSIALTSLLVVAGLAMSASQAFATHFRYGSITWTTPNPAQPNTIQIRFDAAWRWNYPDWMTPAGLPVDTPFVGQVITSVSTAHQPGNYTFNIYNNANQLLRTVPLNMTVTSVDSINDVMTTSFTTIFTFPGTGGPFHAQFDDCCRLTSLQNGNSEANFIVKAGIAITNPINHQPVAGTLPILNVQFNNPAATFTVPAFDPDNDPLTYTIPPSTESGLVNTVPPGLSLNQSSGLVTWRTNTPGLLVNQLYAVQFKVADDSNAYTVVDLLLHLVAVNGQPPTVKINNVAASASFNVVRGTQLTYTVSATDPETSTVLLNNSAPPTGSFMSPSLPFTGSGNVSSTFTWTPSPSQLGSYVIQYSAVDGNGQQGTQSVSITVTNNRPTVTCVASGGTIEATSSAGALFSVTSDLADADDDLLTRMVFIDNILKTTQAGINPPVSLPFSQIVGLGNHTYEVRVTDNIGAPVSCVGTFSIVDHTAPSIIVPNDITTTAIGEFTPTPYPPATATDAVDATPTITCLPPSGFAFPVGANQVTCTATDDFGNVNTASFFVNVNQAQTALSMPTAPSGVLGVPFTVSTTLTRTSAPSGPLGNLPVSFTFTAPDSTVVTLSAVSNPSTGVATVAFAPSIRGPYSVSANFAGTTAFASSSSSSQAFTAYQRTAIQLSPITGGVAGAPVTVHATLTAVPQGTGLQGLTVNFDFGAGIGASATTDSNGVATASVTFDAAGNYTGTVSFLNGNGAYTDSAGSIPPQATIDTRNFSVAPAVTSITLSAPSTGLVGNSITATADLTRVSAPSGPIEGATVIFSLTDPFVADYSVTTDASGHASVTIPLTLRGPFSLVVHYDGSIGNSSSSSTLALSVYQRTHLQVSNAQTAAGANLVLTAQLSAVPGGAPIALQQLAFASTGNPMMFPDSAFTDGNGSASSTLNYYQAAGTFSFTATFFNLPFYFVDDNGNQAPTTGTATVAVTKADTALDALIVPSTAFVSDNLAAATVLTRTTTPAGAISGATVDFVLAGPSVTTSAPAATGGSGEASATFSLAERGAHAVSANYAGTATLNGATTGASSIAVYQKTRLTVAPATAQAGTGVTLSATLITIPGNTAVPNQIVTFDFGGFVPSQTATTDLSGQASVSVMFPTAGTYTMTVSFSNVAGFFANRHGSLAADVEPATVTVSDPTPPAITHTILGTQGNGGYYTSDVAISFSVTDHESVATATGCGPTTTTTDGNNITITCTATSLGGTSTDSVTFSRDTVAPSLTTSANISVTSTSGAGAIVNYSAPSATDATSGVASASCTPAAGPFPVGTTTVNCTAIDNAGHDSHASFTVTVTDSTPPVITPTVTGTLGSNGWYVSNVAVSWSVTDPESGISSSTGCGATSITSDDAAFVVTCSATNGAGSSSTQSVTIKRDVTPPVPSHSPNRTVPATSTAGAVVTYVPIFNSDATSGPAAASCSPASGSTFPIGVTTVNCNAADNAGNTWTGSFTITVTDTVPPVITSTTPSVSSLSPPNHQMVPITVSVAATDNLGPSPACSITGVTSNEPQNGLGDGDTPNDWLLTGGLTVQLRAERAGGGSGRIYTIAVRCVDASGNAATSSTQVKVPKSQSK